MIERTVYQVLRFRMLKANEEIPNSACLYVLEDEQERTWVSPERAQAEAETLARASHHRIGFVVRERVAHLSDTAYEFKKELQSKTTSKGRSYRK